MSEKTYYFNGGVFCSDGEDTFDAVRPTGGLPYVTTSPKGTKLCEHHSSVYRITPDFTGAIMEHSNFFIGHPKSVKLTPKLSKELKEAVKILESKSK